MAGSRRGTGNDEARMRSGLVGRLRQRLSLPHLETRSTSLRTLVLNALFLLMIVVVVPVVFTQFRRDQVIIEPIAVPEALAAQGLTPDVAASRIWDGLHDVNEEAHTSKETIAALPDSRRVEFSFPDSGFSFESLIFHLRRLVGAYETRIAGEFVCASASCDRQGMQLRLRVVTDDVEIIDLPPLGTTPERSYFRDAAAGILSILDPFVAIAAGAEREPLRATILARHLIRSRHADAKWAHNLIGNIRSDADDLPGAIEEYRAALALDPTFLIARSNLGNVLRLSGDMVAAKAEFDAIARAEPGNVRAMEGFADLALAAGDNKAAVAHLLAAADADPLSPRYFARAGRVEIDTGNGAEGEALLARALEIDPGYLPAFAVLAATHLAKGDYAGAEPIYRDAADYAPKDAETQASHGRILTILKRCEEALVRFERATALVPANADYRLQAGRCLQMLARHDEALTALEAAARLAPASAEIWMSIGDSLREKGRNADAVAAYRKFLELDTDSAMRPVAERYIQLLSG